MNNKTLVIISGVSASIGQEILKKYLLEQDTLIYGITRKGVNLDDLSVLPEHHLAVKVDLNNPDSITEFINKIPKNQYKRINYFHSVGEFKTEINIKTHNKCLVMSLVEGTSVDLITLSGYCNRFSFAETFVVPAAAGEIRIINRSAGDAMIVFAFVKYLTV